MSDEIKQKTKQKTLDEPFDQDLYEDEISENDDIKNDIKIDIQLDNKIDNKIDNRIDNRIDNKSDLSNDIKNDINKDNIDTSTLHESSSKQELKTTLDADTSDDVDAKKHIDEYDKEVRVYNSTKVLIWTVAILIIIFGLFVFLFPTIKQQFYPDQTLEQLKQNNFNGKETDNNYVYNGFSFAKMDDLWFTDVRIHGTAKDYSIPMQYGPRELEDIPVIGGFGAFNTALSNNTEQYYLYITFDPTKKDQAHVALAMAELTENLGRVLNLGILASCTKNHTACDNPPRPIINCTNTDKPVILINEKPGTKVELVGNNCLVLQGQDFELTRATERFLYQWYGIMR